MITTAVFDIGQVLIRHDPRAALAGHLDPVAIERFLVEIDFEAWNLRLDGGLPVAQAQAELALTHPDLAHLLGVYVDNFHLATAHEIPGSAEVVRELAANGTRLLCITNFSAETFPGTLARFEILRAFEGIVVSGFERVLKPDPAIYRILIDRHGVDPAEAVFIDDKEANVAAARALGMLGITFTDAAALRVDLGELGLLP